MDLIFQELESERVKLMEDVQSNKKKMKELEDNLLYRLTSTKVIVALRKNIMIPKYLEKCLVIECLNFNSLKVNG